MNKLMLSALCAVFCGCSGRVDEKDVKGDLAEYTFKVKFKGICFYQVKLLNGDIIYVGVKEGNVATIK